MLSIESIFVIYMDRNEEIIGYYSNQPTWQLVKFSAYKRQFTHQLAIHYLEHEIFESVDREMQHILSGQNAGFYAGLRFLFAEVTALSHLYWGVKSFIPRKESAYVARFMRKFGVLPPEHGVHYETFRHGLMHSHHPKWIKKGNRIIGWYISNTAKANSFGIFIPEFTEQVKNTISAFIAELRVEEIAGKNTRLKKFIEGYTHTAKVLKRRDLGKYSRTDFSKVPIT